MRPYDTAISFAYLFIMSRVARYHADRTNQKLYFARLALQQTAQATAVQPAQAGRETTVFQLQGAVLAFLQELGRYYRIDERRPTIATLREALAARGQVSPELVQLENLSQHGFLGELNRAYLACQYAPEPAAPAADETGSSHLIIKVTQSPLAWLPDADILREWHASLTSLIEGFRAEMVEF